MDKALRVRSVVGSFAALSSRLTPDAASGLRSLEVRELEPDVQLKLVKF